jgi:thymidylate synthase
MHFRAATLDDILRELYPALMDRGAPVKASRGPNRELVGVQLELETPRARLSRTETRGRPFSALGEFLWYLTEDNRLDFIQPYIPAYAEDSDDGLTVHGGYGPRIFGLRGHDQLENAIRQLNASSTSRRAVIQIFDAEDNAKRYKEVPCTTTLQFLLREGRLHLITTMRSNDAYLGLPHDVFCFTMLQEMVARILGVDLGGYRHFVGSMHLYDNNRAAARQYLAEGYQRQLEMPPMPPGDPRPAIRHLFDAERRIRAQRHFDAGIFGLDPYWTDLVRLLQIHFAAGNEARLDALRADLVHTGYRTFAENQRGKNPLQTAEPAQGALPL